MTAEKKFNFSKSYAELQKIVEWFEKDKIDLEEGIGKFEEGVLVMKELKKYLDEMENKVKEIKEKV